MIKALLSFAAIALLFAASCTKRDDSNIYHYDYDSSNTWTVGALSYRATSPSVSLAAGRWEIGAATDTGTVNTISFTFNTSDAPIPGRYLVVGRPTIDDREVFVNTASYNGAVAGGYIATGNDSLFAIVNVNKAKVSVTLPRIWAKNIRMNTFDSLQVSATSITQP